MINSPWSLLFSNSALSFLTKSPHRWIVFLYSSPGTHSWFLCLRIFFFFSTLCRMSLLSHAGLELSLSKLIHMGIKSSCAVRKMFLKSWQLCSASLFLSLGRFPGECHPLLPKTTESFLPKVQHTDSTLHKAHVPQDIEFHQDIMTTAQTATNLDIPN